MAFAYFQNQFVSIEQAKVSIQNITFQYGIGIFEGIRAYWNQDDQQLYLFRPHDHHERMLRNCRVYKFDIGKTEAEIHEITLELLRKNQAKTNTYVRPIVYLDANGVGPKLTGYDRGFAIYTMPIGEYIDTTRGLNVGFSSWQRSNDNTIPPRCKTIGGYVNSALAKTEALENGFDEAILLTSQGFISEGSAENIFILRDGKLHTPAFSESILEGITRQTIMEIAQKELGLETVERVIGRTELYVADEAFLCGTGAQIGSIVTVDHRPIGNGQVGPICAKLQEIYFDIVKGKRKDYLHWLSPVY